MSEMSDYWDEVAAQERGRPFMLLHPTMALDGNKWCALYGENLQEGVAGFGDSPEDAARAFDKAWYAKVDKPADHETGGGT